MTTPKPFLKWVGGKTQILDTVLDSFPTVVNDYYEPFLGGGSVLLGVLNKVHEKKMKIAGAVYASDVNPRIIHLFQTVQSNVDGLLEELKKLVGVYEKLPSVEKGNRKPVSEDEARTSQESYYYWIRQKYNEAAQDTRETVEAAAMTLFLNKTCFRGVYREGPHGFNVPFGHYKNPGVFDEFHLRGVANLLEGVVFRCISFEKALGGVKKDDFVYLDPPYAPENEKSFVGYVADGFGLEEHKKLFALVKGFAGKKVRFVMSNADVPLVRGEFASGYTIQGVSARRAINSKNPEARTQEVLVTSAKV
jgi:DNA adenine methylase